MTKIAIVYFSEYGHTSRLASAVHRGAALVAGVEVGIFRIDANGKLDPATGATLAEADGLIFGAPCHAGGPAWQFKKFSDEFAGQSIGPRKSVKVSAGFATSTFADGSDLATLTYLFTFSQRLAYVWIGAASEQSQGEAWGAGTVGASAICLPDVLPDAAIDDAALDMASSLGKRVASIALKLNG